jgi:hypothetical protein
MIEWSWAYDYPNAVGGVGNAFAPWMGDMEWLDQTAAGLGTNNLGAVNGGEIDLTDYGAFTTQVGPPCGGSTYGALIGQPSGFPGTSSNGSFGTGYSWLGYPDFQSNYAQPGVSQYVGSDVVRFSGSYYYATTFATTTPPAAPWAPYVYPSGAGNSFSHGPPFPIDFSQQIPFMHLVLPYDQATGDYGCWMAWVNNAFCRGVGWSPNPGPAPDNSQPSWNTVDQHHWFLMIACQVPYAGVQTKYDYVRISQ